MKKKFLISLALTLLILSTSVINTTAQKISNHPVYVYKAKNIDGEEISLEKYRGKVLLIVNVASKCGFTEQYKGLQTLYEKYKDNGFVVLGFPCNQFRGQEPGSNKEIKEFCKTEYEVTFPMFSKIEVNGEDALPLYQYLTDDGSEPIRWNFEKFLINKQGVVIKRYETKITPEDIEHDILKQLEILKIK
jgi:glutathione peroxidase